MSSSQDRPNETRSAIDNRLCRRAFLSRTTLGLGSLALTGLLAEDARALAGDMMRRGRAKRVVMVFLSGGWSQLELFDEKPLLNERRGQDLPDSVRKGQVITQITERQGALAVVGSKFEFRSHGEGGMRISELLPELAQHADKLTLVRSLQTDHVLHEAAVQQLFTGTALLGRPSWGSWVSYALGRANENLPEFVVLLSGGDRLAPLHPRLWHSGFLPGKHQGVPFQSTGDPVLYVNSPPGVAKESRADLFAALRELNTLERERVGDPGIDARIESYEMAARMQTSIPELADLKSESDATLLRYGAERGKASFATNCLLARRLLERDVRFVQICDGAWDHHYGIPRVLPRKCGQIDKPVAALLGDMEANGLLEDTIFLMTGEFGRTSYCEGPLSYDTYGRDHNGRVNCLLLAGAGFKKGFTYGATDEWGWDVVENPVHVHDVQATILHQLGLDHEKLVFRHQGRDFRLTDVAGRVVNEILA